MLAFITGSIDRDITYLDIGLANYLRVTVGCQNTPDLPEIVNLRSSGRKDKTGTVVIARGPIDHRTTRALCILVTNARRDEDLFRWKRWVLDISNRSTVATIHPDTAIGRRLAGRKN